MDIRITDDFHLQKIAESGQCFRWERAGENTYRIIQGSESLYITEKGGGGFRLECSEEEFHTLWEKYFDFDENYGAVRSRIDPQEDPFLYAAAEHEKGIRILRQDPFETLISFIISQNRNIPSIRRSIELLSLLCGRERTDSRGKVYYTFPAPEAILSKTEDQLNQCRTGYRSKYILAAAKAVAEGTIDLKALQCCECGEAVEKLTDLYGVGNKVACCMALFGLHQLNAFPRDVWIRRVLEKEYPGGYPFERYSPYNGVYQQYMFAYYRNRQITAED